MSNDTRPEIWFPGFTEDWEERKLGDMMDVTSVKRIHQSDWTNSGIRFLRARDIVSAAKNEEPSDYLYISEEKYNEYSKISGKVSQGDLLVTGVGSIGVPLLITDDNPIYFKDGNIIWFKNEHKIDGNFFYYSFINNKIQKYIRDVAGIGTVGTYTIDSGKKTPISLPTYDEQIKIGSFFKQLDHTIMLHQHELDLLKETKKGFLQKMFPKNGAKVPEIRFPGFTEDWEERKWYDTVNMSTDMVDPKEGEYDDLPHIGPGNIESFTGRILNNVNTVREDNLISGKFHFNSGDIIYGKINPQLAKYAYVNFEGLTSADTYVLKSHNGIIQDFLFVILQTKDFYKYSVSVSMRTGMPKINRDELNQYNYLSPSNIDEQRKIGSFFNQLDNTITLHQRKLDLLKETKKGFLQKMFV